MSERDENLDFEMLELLYDEVDEAKAAEIRAKLLQNPEAEAKYESWQSVRQMSAQLDVEEPDLRVHYHLLRAAKEAHEVPKYPWWLKALKGLGNVPAVAGLAVVVVSAGLLYHLTGELHEERGHSEVPIASGKTESPSATSHRALDGKSQTDLSRGEASPQDEAAAIAPEMNTLEAPQPPRVTEVMPYGKADRIDLTKKRLERSVPKTSKAKPRMASVGRKSKLSTQTRLGGVDDHVPVAKRQARGVKKRRVAKGKPRKARLGSTERLQQTRSGNIAEFEAPARQSARRARATPDIKFAPAPPGNPVVATPEQRFPKGRIKNGDRLSKQSVGAAVQNRKAASASDETVDAVSQLEQARAARRASKLDEAIQLYTKHLASRPKRTQSENVWFEMADTFERLGRYAQARLFYTQVVMRGGALKQRAQTRLDKLATKDKGNPSRVERSR